MEEDWTSSSYSSSSYCDHRRRRRHVAVAKNATTSGDPCSEEDYDPLTRKTFPQGGDDDAQPEVKLLPSLFCRRQPCAPKPYLAPLYQARTLLTSKPCTKMDDAPPSSACCCCVALAAARTLRRLPRTTATTGGA